MVLLKVVLYTVVIGHVQEQVDERAVVYAQLVPPLDLLFVRFKALLSLVRLDQEFNNVIHVASLVNQTDQKVLPICE